MESVGFGNARELFKDITNILKNLRHEVKEGDDDDIKGHEKDYGRAVGHKKGGHEQIHRHSHGRHHPGTIADKVSLSGRPPAFKNMPGATGKSPEADKVGLPDNTTGLPGIYNQNAVVKPGTAGVTFGSVHLDLYFNSQKRFNITTSTAGDSGTQVTSLSYERVQDASLSLDFNFLAAHRNSLTGEELESFDTYMNSQEFFKLATAARQVATNGKTGLDSFNQAVDQFFNGLENRLGLSSTAFDTAQEAFKTSTEKFAEQITSILGDSSTPNITEVLPQGVEAPESAAASSQETTPGLLSFLPGKIEELIEDIKENLEQFELDLEGTNLESPSLGNGLVTLLDDLVNELKEVKEKLAPGSNDLDEPEADAEAVSQPDSDEESEKLVAETEADGPDSLPQDELVGSGSN